MRNLLEFIPFILITRTTDGKRNTKLNIARLIEAFIIILITVFLSAYIAVAKLEVKLENLEHRVQRIEKVLDWVVKEKLKE